MRERPGSTSRRGARAPARAAAREARARAQEARRGPAAGGSPLPGPAAQGSPPAEEDPGGRARGRSVRPSRAEPQPFRGRNLLALELAALGLDFWEGVRHILFFLAGIALAGWIRTYKFHVRLRKRLPASAAGRSSWPSASRSSAPCAPAACCRSWSRSSPPVAAGARDGAARGLAADERRRLRGDRRLLGPTWANAKLVAAVFMGLWAGLVTHLVARRGFEAEEIFRGPIPVGDMHDPTATTASPATARTAGRTGSRAATRTSSSSFWPSRRRPPGRSAATSSSAS